MSNRRVQSDDVGVHAEHRAALARGEARFLFRTETGELYSYSRDELGFPPEGAPHNNRPTTWRMGVMILSIHVRYTRERYRAEKLRRERGVPRPGRGAEVTLSP